MSSDLSSDVIDGKSKQSDSEFDMDTESIGNNFPGQNILSNMDFSLPICARVMEELAKARLKIAPYDTTGGWRDPHMWSTLMGVVVGSNCPKMRDNVLEIISMFERLFLLERYYEITDEELRINVYTVFGPGSDGDAGSLRTCNLDAKLQAVRRIDHVEVPSSILQYDGDDVGECVVQHGGGPSNSPPNQSRKKAKTMMLTAQTKFERLSNRNPSVPPRYFEDPMFSILTRNDMSELYANSTKHLTPEDAGIFLFHVAPGDVKFQSLAILPFAKRKATIDAMMKEYKARNCKPSLHPHYLSHHPQE